MSELLQSQSEAPVVMEGDRITDGIEGLSDLIAERDALQTELSEMVIDPEDPESQETYDQLTKDLAELEGKISTQSE